MDKGRGGEGGSPSWDTRRLCRERIRVYLLTSRLIDELGWVGPAEALEDTVCSARRKVVAACDYSMPCRKRRPCRKDLIGEVEKDPWGLAFKIVTKILATRRKTPGLDNPDPVMYIGAKNSSLSKN